MQNRILNLQRDEYLDSIASIQDTPSRRFADQSLEWWDRHFSWKAQGCDVLLGENDEHLSYMFSKVDRYGEYLTIYNLFTPEEERRNGYAKELLEQTIDTALENHVRRITFSSISSSLDFYLRLGFTYWGANEIGNYHCDLPIPSGGLCEIQTMTQTESTEYLLGSKAARILSKVQGNGEHLSDERIEKICSDQQKMGDQCRYAQLLEISESNSEESL